MSDKTDLELYQELQKKLLAKIRSSKTSPRDLPALSRELRNITKDIGELSAEEEESEATRIKRMREERRAQRHPDSNVSDNSP